MRTIVAIMRAVTAGSSRLSPSGSPARHNLRLHTHFRLAIPADRGRLQEQDGTGVTVTAVKQSVQRFSAAQGALTPTLPRQSPGRGGKRSELHVRTSQTAVGDGAGIICARR